jgi:tRNA-specific 2-thiouridylase
MNWLGIPEPQAPIQTEVQIRYRSRPAKVNVIPLEDGRVKLMFEEPQFGVTPGQAAVFYEGDVVLGGGLIERF